MSVSKTIDVDQEEICKLLQLHHFDSWISGPQSARIVTVRDPVALNNELLALGGLNESKHPKATIRGRERIIRSFAAHSVVDGQHMFEVVWSGSEMPCVVSHKDLDKTARKMVLIKL